MDMSRCKQLFSCNITIDCEHKHYDLTIFPATLERFLGKGLDNAQIEERLLDLYLVNVIVNMQSKKCPDSDHENSPDTDDKETALDQLIFFLLKSTDCTKID